MRVPELWLVAGPNGAGKTTCVQKEPISNFIPGVQFFNPDERTLTKLRVMGYSGFPDAPIELQTRLFLNPPMKCMPNWRSVSPTTRLAASRPF